MAGRGVSRLQLLAPPTLLLLALVFLGEAPSPVHAHGIIIPPPWADEDLNPCAKESWQLLHWPQDNTCYYIFTQGPCGETQELYFDEGRGSASCRCSRGTSWHPKSKECHRIHSRGPCGRREYFALKEFPEGGGPLRPHGECRLYEECPPGQLFWPAEGKCFLHLARGPCQDGHLLYVHPETGATECGCHPAIMATNYWPHRGTCHELFTKGPCVEGHILVYNMTKGATECVCGPHLLTNYHPPTGRCYQLDTPGPCRQGQVFTYDPARRQARCSCLPDYIEWPLTGACYRTYTRGPCPSGEVLRPRERKAGMGSCSDISCSPGELFHPSTEQCYPVGRRGPCSWGKLWIFERATSVRGSCHCDPFLIGFWEPHGVCYELGERGPCPKRKILSYDKDSGRLKCRCDLHRGYVPWANGRCIKAGVRRNKLIPVSRVASPRGNSIHVERVHRGLTLPARGAVEDFSNDPSLSQVVEEQKEEEGSLPRGSSVQEEILKDVLTTILSNDSSPNDLLSPLPPPPHREVQTNVESTIHRITMSRSVSSDGRRAHRGPRGGPRGGTRASTPPLQGARGEPKQGTETVGTKLRYIHTGADS